MQLQFLLLSSTLPPLATPLVKSVEQTPQSIPLLLSTCDFTCQQRPQTSVLIACCCECYWHKDISKANLLTIPHTQLSLASGNRSQLPPLLQPLLQTPTEDFNTLNIYHPVLLHNHPKSPSRSSTHDDAPHYYL